MPFVSTPDFPVEKGQREPQNPAGFGGNAALRRPQDPPKISWDPLQLEFRSNLSPLELGQLSLVRDYCQFRAWAAKNNFKIHQNNFVLCWPLKGSAEVESSSSLVWRKENFFFKGISGQDTYLNWRNFIWDCHSLLLIFHDVILKSVYFCKYITSFSTRFVCFIFLKSFLQLELHLSHPWGQFTFRFA